MPLPHATRPAERARVTIALSSLRPGGAERVAAWLAGGLAQRGHPTTLVLLCGPDEPRAYALPSGVTLVCADILWPSSGPGRLADMFRRLARLRRAIADARPDVLVSFLDTVNVRVLLATVGLGLPTAVSERIDPRQHPLPAPWRWLRRLLYPLARTLVIQTEGLRQAWPTSWREGIRVIPNPVRRVEPRGRVDLPPRSVLCVARLDPQKGLDLLVRAFAAIAEEQDAFLVLVGEGPLRGELEALAATLEVAGRVRLVGAVDDVGAWLAAATIFALPSHYEGQPNALAEAMAAGLPVVATDTPGALSLVRDGENGLVVPRGDAAALARALRELLAQPERAAALGRAAKGLAGELDEESVLARWADLVEELNGAKA